MVEEPPGQSMPDNIVARVPFYFQAGFPIQSAGPTGRECLDHVPLSLTGKVDWLQCGIVDLVNIDPEAPISATIPSIDKEGFRVG